ncbi:Calpain-D [Diplonema papillatum]|nr:Calpain-D [Diplonema papillatum]
MSQGTNNRLFNAIERAKQEVLQMHLSVSPNKDGRGLGFGMGQPITPPIHGAGDAGSTTGCLPPKAGEDRSASLRAPGNADGMSTSAAAAELLERFAAANAARAELNSQRSTALVSRGGGHVGSPQRGASTFPALKPASTVDPARDLFGHLGGGSPSRQLPTKPADHTPQHNQHNQHRHAVSHAPPSPNPYLREVSSAHATPLAHGDSHQQPHHPSSPPRSPAAASPERELEAATQKHHHRQLQQQQQQHLDKSGGDPFRHQYHASPPPPGGSNPSGVSEHGLAYLKALDATGLLLHGGKPSPPRSPPATGSSIVVRSIAASPAADLFRSYSAAGLPEAPGWRPGEAEPSRFPAGYGDAREIRKQADRIVEQARQDQIRAYSVRTESVDEQARHLAAGEDRRAQEQQALQHKQHQADQIRAYNAHTESIDEKNKYPASGEEWRALEQQVPHKQHQDQIRAYGAHTESIDEQKKYPASGEDLEQQRQGQMRAYSTHADSVAEQKRNLAAGDERAAREQQVLLQQQQALATQQADLREQQARWHATVGGEVERIRVEERQKALQHLRDHPPPPHLRPAGAPARDAPTPAVLALYLPPTHDEPAAFPADGPQFEETWRVVRDAWAAELAVWKELCVQKDNSSAQRDSDVATLKLRVRALESELSEAQAQLAQKCQAFAQQKAALLLRYGVAGDAAAEPGTSAAPQPTHQPAAGLSAAPAQPTTRPPPQQQQPACPAPSSNDTSMSQPARDQRRSRTPERPNGMGMIHGRFNVHAQNSAANQPAAAGVAPAVAAAAAPARSPSGDRAAARPVRSSRSRTPEIAEKPGGGGGSSSSGTASRSSSLRSGFAKRGGAGPRAKEADEVPVAEPAAALAVAPDAPWAPPADFAGWKAALSGRKRTVHSSHPCVSPSGTDVDLTVDAGVSPCVLSGERKEITHGLYVVSNPCAHGGTQLAFYNALHDTQFNLRYTFSPDPQGRRMTALHPEAVERGPSDFGVSVYPGESKLFVDGVTTTNKMSLSFGPIEAAERQPRPLAPELRQQLQAVRLLLQGSDCKRTCAADIDALCRRGGIPFVDLSFPPLAVSVARLWQAGSARHLREVWTWRRLAVQAADIAATDITPGALSSPAVVEATRFASLFCLDAIRRCFVASTNDSQRMLLKHSGWWHAVTVDNCFPVNVSGEPLCAHTGGSTGQKWPIFVEKGLAKLKGGYSALHGMTTAEAICSIAGYSCSESDVDVSDGEALWSRIVASKKAGAFVLLTVGAQAPRMPTTMTEGSHAVVVNARETTAGRLLQVKPLGTGKWQGNWSPLASNWTSEVSVECQNDPSDGTQWMAVDDVSSLIAGVTLLDPRWEDATTTSVAGFFESGTPDTILHITYDGPPVDIQITLSQRDPTGLPSVDPDSLCTGLMVGLLHQNKEGDPFNLLALSGEGVYIAGKEVTVTAPLRKGSSFVCPQAFHPVDKSFVVSVKAHDTSRLSVRFHQRQRASGSAKHCFPQPLAAFNPRSALPVQGSRPYQVVRPNAINTGAGACVRYQRTTSNFDDTMVVSVRRPPTSAVKPGAAPKADGAVPLEVVVVSGKNLQAGREGSKPACYCEVKLVQMNAAGEWLSLSGTLRRTRYVLDTTGPTWGEPIDYSAVAPSDYLFLKCFDRDLFSQDEMGEVLLSLAEFIQNLVPGGPPSINWYPLQGSGATGTVQLSISIPVQA